MGFLGLFADRSADAYNKAAHAVQNGTASPEQRAMNGPRRQDGG